MGQVELKSGVSVIIPLYNKVATVRRAVESALTQTGIDVEVIVIDDGSTDGSVDQLGAYRDRIVYQRQPRAGPSAARNQGARLARHSLLAFLDADDQYLPGCLSAHVSCRHQRPDTEISLASFLVMHGGEPESEETISERVEEGSAGSEFVWVAHPSPAGVINVHIGAICVNRDLFDSVGRFDPVLQCWEITEFLYRLSIKKRTACLIRRPGLIVHKDPHNSQFQRANAIPANVEQFAHRLLDRIGELPAAQRTVFLNQVDDLAYSLWNAGALQEFRRMTARARLVGGWVSGAKARRMAKLATVPFPVLWFLWRLRYSRQFGGTSN